MRARSVRRLLCKLCGGGVYSVFPKKHCIPPYRAYRVYFAPDQKLCIDDTERTGFDLGCSVVLQDFLCIGRFTEFTEITERTERTLNKFCMYVYEGFNIFCMYVY